MPRTLGLRPWQTVHLCPDVPHQLTLHSPSKYRSSYFPRHLCSLPHHTHFTSMFRLPPYTRNLFVPVNLLIQFHQKAPSPFTSLLQPLVHRTGRGNVNLHPSLPAPANNPLPRAPILHGNPHPNDLQRHQDDLRLPASRRPLLVLLLLHLDLPHHRPLGLRPGGGLRHCSPGRRSALPRRRVLPAPLRRVEGCLVRGARCGRRGWRRSEEWEREYCGRGRRRVWTTDVL